jgi:hypothetical protein
LVESGRIRFEHLDEDLTALARFVVRGRGAGTPESASG